MAELAHTLLINGGELRELGQRLDAEPRWLCHGSSGGDNDGRKKMKSAVNAGP
jgi:hypothetical protein